MFAALLALALLRLVAALVPTMHLWGLNPSRFAPPVVSWALWAAAVAALLPPVGRALAPALGALGDALADRRAWAAALLGSFAVGMLLAFPDRTGFVGDYLLRAGILQEPGGFERMFPQAMPLDGLLHWRIPRALGAGLGIGPDGAARAIGAIEGLALALVAARAPRAFDLRGPAAAAAAFAVLFCGGLTLYTGYGKPTTEIVLLTAVAAVAGAAMLRTGGDVLPFGLAVAAALGVHRASWAMLPGALAIVALWWWRHGRHGAWRRPASLAGLAIAALATALLLPRFVTLLVGFDLAVNLQSHEVREQGGVLRTAFSPLRLMDLANVLLLHAPLALALPALAARGALGTGRRIAGLGPLALFASFLPSLLFVYVTQGPFRDWDAYGGSGAALAVLAAWGLGEALRPPGDGAGFPRAAHGADPGAPLAAPAALAAIAGALTLLLAHHDPQRGLARVRALLDEPPRRTVSQRHATLDFLGLRALRDARWSEAAARYEALAAEAPHPRALELWGTAALIAGDDAGAQRAFERLVARAPEQPVGWWGLWTAAGARGDTAAARRAAERIRSWSDDGPEMRRVVDHLDHYPGMRARMPGAAGRRRPRRLRGRSLHSSTPKCRAHGLEQQRRVGGPDRVRVVVGGARRRPPAASSRTRGRAGAAEARPAPVTARAAGPPAFPPTT